MILNTSAGIGRTGTVLAAYFIAQKKMTTEEALNFVRSKRPAVETTTQRRFLVELEKKVKEGTF